MVRDRAVTPAAVAAVDLGASSGRVMLAGSAPGRLELVEIARFANDAVGSGARCTGTSWRSTGECSHGVGEAGREAGVLQRRYRLVGRRLRIAG